MLPAATGYGYNKSAHRYYNAETGRFVGRQAVRDSLESVMDLSALRMNALSQQLADGVISLADWQRGMMQQIKLAHTASASLARGGFAQVSPSDWGLTGALVKDQYNYLRNFAQEIADGKQPLDGRFLVRSDMYGDAANTTYATMRTRGFESDGFDEERRILEDKVNACDDCIDYADEGWQPIGTLPEPGVDSVCMVRCRCEKEYRRSGEAETEEQ